MLQTELQWTVYDFSRISDEELFQRYTTLPKSSLGRPPGKNRTTERGHWAGRITLHSLLQSNSIDAFIRPNPDYGFLEIVTCSDSSERSWYASISHTESIAVAALSTAPVGIDIENKNRSVTPVLSKLVTPEELQNFHSSPVLEKLWLSEPELLIWSGKESFLKALGLGISGGLGAVGIQWSKKPYPVIHDLKGPLSLREPRLTFLMHENYLVSVCSEEGLSPIKHPLL